MAQDPPDVVSFRLSPRKARLGMLASAAIAAVIGLLLLSSDDFSASASEVLGLGFVALCMAWAVTSQYEKGVSDRSPQLVLDAEGLLAPRLFARKLPWPDIRGYDVVSQRGQGTMLVLDVVDPDRFGPVCSDPANWLGALVRSTRFRLEIGELEGDAAAILAALARFAPRPGGL